eukprot:2090522-Pleurochrysis_carterae.AAC.1
MLRGLTRAHSGARQSGLRCGRARMAGRSKTRCAREHGGRRRAARCVDARGRATPLREAILLPNAQRGGVEPDRRVGATVV